jgi:hypothetical protein
MNKLRGEGEAFTIVALWVFTVVFVFVACCFLNKPSDPYLAKLMSKYDAVKLLNEERTQKNIPPVGLIELNGPRWRAEQLARSGRADGDPAYWNTKLDGGFYPIEEVIMSLDYSTPPVDGNFWHGMHNALFDRGGPLLNPCYNYVAMDVAYRRQNWYWTAYYVFWMVGRWVNWTSPPTYSNGRFTAEGYAAPEMKPIAVIVRHGGKMQLCKYLDPPAPCKDVPAELGGAITASKDLDSGYWYFKIDAPLRLNETGLYVVELIAEDLRTQGRKCTIMQYAIQNP